MLISPKRRATYESSSAKEASVKILQEFEEYPISANVYKLKE